MADIENKQDFVNGFGAGLALLGVCAFVALGVFLARGGDLSDFNTFIQPNNQVERADEIQPWRLNLGFGPESNRRGLRMDYGSD